MKLRVFLVMAALVLTVAGCTTAAPTAAPTAVPSKPTAQAPTTQAAAPTAKPAAPTPAKLNVPDPIVVTTYEIGGDGYLFSAGMGEGITKATGTKVRVIPTSSGIARTALVTSGKAQLITAPGDVLVEGLEDYAKLEWGPQPLRLVYNTFMLGGAMYVRGDSDIKKLSDLKGKKVDKPASPDAVRNTENCLAFGGLTYKDVNSSVSSTSGAQRADMLKTGQLDSFYYTIGAAFLFELETMPGGLRALPMPADDVEGWARLHKLSPWIAPRLAQPKEGAGFNGQPTWVYTKSYPTFSAMASLNDDTAYFVTKTLMENYALYKDLSPQMRISTPESALDIVGKVIVPYHDGSVKYFKEKGLWTDKHEKWNNALLERQTVLKAAFEKAIVDAAAQKVKEADFPAFWLKSKPPVIDIDATMKQAGLK